MEGGVVSYHRVRWGGKVLEMPHILSYEAKKEGERRNAWYVVEFSAILSVLVRKRRKGGTISRKNGGKRWVNSNKVGKPTWDEWGQKREKRKQRGWGGRSK